MKISNITNEEDSLLEKKLIEIQEYSKLFDLRLIKIPKSLLVVKPVVKPSDTFKKLYIKYKNKYIKLKIQV